MLDWLMDLVGYAWQSLIGLTRNALRCAATWAMQNSVFTSRKFIAWYIRVLAPGMLERGSEGEMGEFLGLHVLLLVGIECLLAYRLQKLENEGKLYAKLQDGSWRRTMSSANTSLCHRISMLVTIVPLFVGDLHFYLMTYGHENLSLAELALSRVWSLTLPALFIYMQWNEEHERNRNARDTGWERCYGPDG